MARQSGRQGAPALQRTLFSAPRAHLRSSDPPVSGGFCFWKQVSREGRKASGSAPSRPPGTAGSERGEAHFGGSELDSPPSIPAEERLPRGSPRAFRRALGSYRKATTPQHWRSEPLYAHTPTHAFHPLPQLFASYPLVMSLFYFLKTRQFKRRKCSKLANRKKWPKETVPLYQASNSRAGKGVSVQYVPDS